MTPTRDGLQILKREVAGTGPAACLGPSLVHREHLLTAVAEVRRRRVAAIAAPSQQALQDVVRLLRAAIRKQVA